MFNNMAEDYDAFFEYGAGAMLWRFDEEGRRLLLFLAPDIGAENITGTICSEIYTETDGKNWKTPGPVRGWDGNLEQPTFNPSIWLLNREGWHGFIRNGDLVTA